VDHVVIPLDRDHGAVLAVLADDLARAAGLPAPAEDRHAHVTVVSYAGLGRSAALEAARAVAADSAPLVVHAHGYGFFTGDDPTGLSLHVPVVRTALLDALHQRVCAALHRAGAQVAGWSEPDIWSPHITLVDRGLDPARLGAGAAWLARRHHPSWNIPVDRLQVIGRPPEPEHDRVDVPFGPGTVGAPRSAVEP
jgi:2'-5' RNA ligase